ncbi:MAG: tRNA-(ms[2]io[6]A)-hydroxylase [Cyclobacteriaceae bacterium]
MQLRLELTSESSQQWLDTVMTDFPSFLQDHADCERKASAMAMSFVAKYPDRIEMIPELIETGLEELEHFQQVYQLMEKRGIQLAKEMKQDQYVKQLIDLCKSDPINRFLDRLLIASIVECRGAERFRMVYEAQQDTELKEFYRVLWASEAKHGDSFVKLALLYFEEKKVFSRLHELNEAEGKLIHTLPFKAALH